MRKKSTVVKLIGLALLAFLLFTGTAFVAGYYGGLQGTERGLESGLAVASHAGGALLLITSLALIALAAFRVFRNDSHD